MNYLIYPTKVMGISQSYLGTYSHTKHYKGVPQAFPIDEACNDSGREYFYCPCDEIEIKRIYGIGAKGTNTIWLQSTSKVVTPTFTDYVTIMVIHPNDDDLSKLKVGQKFKRYEPMFREGVDGQATGNHFHFSISKSMFSQLSGSGWVQNSLQAWVMDKNNKKPEDCFYVDPTFTTIKRNQGIKFTKLYGQPIIKDINKRQVEVFVDDLRLRKEPNGEILGFIKRGIYDILEEKDGWLKIKDGYIGKGKWLSIYEIVKPIEPTPLEPIPNEPENVQNSLLKALLELIKLLIEKLKGGKL